MFGEFETNTENKSSKNDSILTPSDFKRIQDAEKRAIRKINQSRNPKLSLCLRYYCCSNLNFPLLRAYPIQLMEHKYKQTTEISDQAQLSLSSFSMFIIRADSSTHLSIVLNISVLFCLAGVATLFTFLFFRKQGQHLQH